MFYRENHLLQTRIQKLIETQQERLHQLEQRINWMEYKRYLHEGAKLMTIFEERAERVASLHSLVEVRSQALEMRAVWLKGFSPMIQLIEELVKAIEQLRNYVAEQDKLAANNPDKIRWTQEYLEQLQDLDRAMQRLEIELNIDPDASKDSKI